MQTNGPFPHFSGRPLPLANVYAGFNQLKRLYRQGWLRRGLNPEQCESVADHIFGVALLTLLLADAYFPACDNARAVRMALLHEVGEIEVGDLIPGDGHTNAEKHQREKSAARRIFADLERGEEYLDLWEEFEAGQTFEARLVRQVDRLEMALQARLYQADGWLNPDEFLASAAAVIDLPELQALLAGLEEK